jgi:hypothetical protein
MEREVMSWAEIKALMDETAKTNDRTAKIIAQAEEDRIRDAAEFKADMAEFRASLDRMAEDSKRRSDMVNAQIAATDAQIAATDAQIAETEAQIAETEAQIAKTDAQIAKTEAQLAATSAELSGVGITNGMLTEDLIYNALCDTMTFGGAVFDDIDRSIRRKRKSPDGQKIRGEFDVALYNCNAIALIDIKYRARIGDIDYLINTQLPKFRMFFPQYKNYKTYLGLGGLAFEEGVEAAALQMGIGTLKLNGEAVEVNDGNVKAWG